MFSWPLGLRVMQQRTLALQSEHAFRIQTCRQAPHCMHVHMCKWTHKTHMCLPIDMPTYAQACMSTQGTPTHEYVCKHAHRNTPAPMWRNLSSSQAAWSSEFRPCPAILYSISKTAQCRVGDGDASEERIRSCLWSCGLKPTVCEADTLLSSFRAQKINHLQLLVGA